MCGLYSFQSLPDNPVTNQWSSSRLCACLRASPDNNTVNTTRPALGGGDMLRAKASAKGSLNFTSQPASTARYVMFTAAPRAPSMATLAVLESALSGLRISTPAAAGSQVWRRHASHQAQGRANKAADGAGKRLGAKKSGGEFVVPGNIIFKQRGTLWFPGDNCSMVCLLEDWIEALLRGQL
jgi:ribosomal protein L27